MKLIQLTPEHYVIADDSAIKEGDCVVNGNNKIFQYTNESISGLNYCKKITHSTKELDGVKTLSLPEVKETIGEVDVEKLAEKYIENYCNDNNLESSVLTDAVKTLLRIGFIDGYNRCFKDNKDKKYTENDLKKSFEKGEERGYEEKSCRERYNPLTGYEPKNNKMVFEEIIQHIQSETEWDVEFVDNKIKLI
jgi:hypothetical protein